MGAASERPFELLADRRFAFYPAIRGVEHNEWTLEKDTWSEILARNVLTGKEIWVPRSFLGEISSTDSPVLIVGLKRELEYKAGQLFPYRNPVVELPTRLSGAERAAAQTEAPEPAEPRREATAAESKTLRLIAGALLAGVAALLALAIFALGGFHNPFERFFRLDLATADQRYLSLTAQDAYHTVVAKLGPPSSEKWLTKDDAELHFQALLYPERGYTVILMGASRAEVRYIGTLHEPDRTVIDAARMAGGGDTKSLMRNLPAF